ncbi:hypothetical protein ACTXT7_007467 [Hymenolepis weldensis]
MSEKVEEFTLKEYHERLKNIFKKLNSLKKYEQVIMKSFAIKKAQANEKCKIESSITDNGAQCVFESDSNSASSSSISSTSSLSSLLSFDSSSSKDEVIQRKIPLKSPKLQPKSAQSRLSKSKTTVPIDQKKARHHPNLMFRSIDESESDSSDEETSSEETTSDETTSTSESPDETSDETTSDTEDSESEESEDESKKSSEDEESESEEGSSEEYNSESETSSSSSESSEEESIKEDNMTERRSDSK